MLITLSIFSMIFGCSSETTEENSIPKDREPIEWQRGNPPLTIEDDSIRAILHLHSHHSHDACDGEPQPDGIPDEACLGDLRSALCEVRIDAAFLSDHPARATEVENFEELFLIRDDDQQFYENGVLLANQINCENGHKVLLFPGVEANKMMPLRLTEHIEHAYDGSEIALEQVRAQNGLQWVAHTEQREVVDLAAMNLDGLELYQLHANLDPDIRADFLDLEPFGYLEDVQPFFFPTEGVDNPPHPDLGFLSFVLPNEPSIQKMEELSQTQAIGISGGTDAHQNVFPIDASDGERIDSYRRMMRWFNTRISVPQGANPQEIVRSVRERKTWIAFETFGTPEGFEAFVKEGDSIYPMGAEFSLKAGQTLKVKMPTLSEVSPQDIALAPNVEGRVFFYNGVTREQIKTWTTGTIELPIEEKGLYRVEIWIQPLHLTPYLGDFSHYAERWVPWVYSGGFFVRE